MAITPHVPIAMAELISCNILCSEFSLPGSYYICHLCTQLVLHIQDAVITLVFCPLFSGTSVSIFMETLAFMYARRWVTSSYLCIIFRFLQTLASIFLMKMFRKLLNFTLTS